MRQIEDNKKGDDLTIKVFGDKAERLDEHSVLFVKEIRYIEGRKVVTLEAKS